MRKKAAFMAIVAAAILILGVRAMAVPEWVKQEREKVTSTKTEVSIKRETSVVERKETIMKDETAKQEYNTTQTVDWKDRYVQVSAEGYSAECDNEAECRIKGEKIARTRAYVMLAQAVEGIRVTDDTTIIDEVHLQSISTTKLNAFIKGGRIVDTKYIKLENQVICVVTLGFLMDGPDGFSQLVLQGVNSRESKEKEEKKENVEVKTEKPAPVETPAVEKEKPVAPPQPENKYAPSLDAAPIIPGSDYTGIIVDARGTGLKPAMSPQILTPDGTIVYGYMNIDPDYVIKVGVAGYFDNPDEAKTNERVGKNPLMVKAISTVGVLKAYSVVSAEDASSIQLANQKSGFLNKCAVIFLID